MFPKAEYSKCSCFVSDVKYQFTVRLTRSGLRVGQHGIFQSVLEWKVTQFKDKLREGNIAAFSWFLCEILGSWLANLHWILSKCSRQLIKGILDMLLVNLSIPKYSRKFHDQLWTHSDILNRLYCLLVTVITYQSWQHLHPLFGILLSLYLSGYYWNIFKHKKCLMLHIKWKRHTF